MLFTVYHNNKERSRNSTIQSRRYDIPFGYSDILAVLLKKVRLKIHVTKQM